MLRIFLAIVSAIFMMSLASGVSAADSGSTDPVDATSTATVTDTGSNLLLTDVFVSDVNTIGLKFSQPMRLESIRVRIIDQSTNENVKVASITGSTDGIHIALVKTSFPLIPGGSYVVTITSALSQTDMTIKAGIDSIREFTVPVDIAGVTLDAPANPTAVMVNSGATPTSTTSVPVLAPSSAVNTGSNATGTTVVPKDVQALPVTGAPTIIMILLAGLMAYTLLVVRKKA